MPLVSVRDRVEPERKEEELELLIWCSSLVAAPGAPPPAPPPPPPVEPIEVLDDERSSFRPSRVTSARMPVKRPAALLLTVLGCDVGLLPVAEVAPPSALAVPTSAARLEDGDIVAVRWPPATYELASPCTARRGALAPAPLPAASPVRTAASSELCTTAWLSSAWSATAAAASAAAVVASSGGTTLHCWLPEDLEGLAKLTLKVSMVTSARPW